ncbi:MAG: hypothetical protein WB996_07825 [Ignavibacteriaceae bacterium]
MHSEKSHFIFTSIAGIIIEIFLLVFISYNGVKGNIPLYMFIYSESFLVMLTAFYFIKNPPRKVKPLPGESGEDLVKKDSAFLKFVAKLLKFKPEDSRKLFIPLLIISFGIIFRLTLFSTINTTSPDVNRYVWEGKILYNGYNPYLLPPNDTALNEFHDGLYNKVTYKNMSAIYPPFAQVIFVAAYMIAGESFIGLKLIYLLFDLLIMWLLLKLLYMKGYNLNNIILYAWMPLILLEYYVNVHLDLVGIFFMMCFIYAMEKVRFYPAVIFFTFAFITKMYPVILFPLVFRKFGFKKSFTFLYFFVLGSLFFFIPFIYKDISIFSSLLTYLKQWQFNASVYYLLLHYLHDPVISRLICTGGFILSVGLISFLYKDFTKACYAIFITLIIFSTTLYPWYLGWIAALNPFYNFYSVTSLLFTVNFSNFTTVSDVWVEYNFVLFTEYILFFGLLIYDLWLLYKNRERNKKI